jgi:uroporphyrinogen decarboxylase
MTPRERVMATLAGEPVDRPPVSFWGHFYNRESSARDLVDATIEFQNEYDWDWIKLNPRKHYHVEEWGVSYEYYGSSTKKPTLSTCPVHQPTDWAAITERAHDRGAFGEQLDAVHLLRREVPEEIPVLETIFTPLAVLGEMVEEPGELKLHMRTHPNAVRGALEAVTRTYERYAEEVLAQGADGIYFATVDWGSKDMMSAEEYREWARPYDLRILDVIKSAPFNVLHVCKRRNLLFEFADYPVAAYSWDATDPINPSLADAFEQMPGALMGGISHEGALQDRDPRAAVREYEAGLQTTGGRRWLVAPGCSIPPATPAANLKAVRTAVDSGRLPEEAPS